MLQSIPSRFARLPAVESGLLYSLKTTTSSAKMVGFQILAGMSVGLGMQNALVAVQ